MAEITEETNLQTTTDAKVEAAKADKSGKDDKPAKKKGPGFRLKVAKFFRDTNGERKKIIWPTKDTILRNTGATLVMCAIIGLAVGLFDFGLGALVGLFLSL